MSTPPSYTTDLPSANQDNPSTFRRPVPASVTITNESTPLIPQQGTMARALSLHAADPQQRQKERLGVWLLILSALAFTAMTACVKLSSINGFGSFEIVFVRSIVQLLLSLLACAIWKINPLGKPGIRQWLLFRALVMSIGLALFFYSLTVLKLMEATVLFSLGPVFTAVIASIVLDERFTGFDAFCTIFCLVGVLYVTKPSLLFTNDAVFVFNTLAAAATTHIGTECALSGAIMSAMSYVTVRKVGKNIHFLVHSVYFGALSSLISPPGLLLFQKLALPSENNWTPALYLLFVGVFAFIGLCLLNQGLKMVPAGLGIVIRSFDIIFAWLTGTLFFHEYPDLRSFFGTFVILAMTVALDLRKLKSRTAQLTAYQAARKRLSRDRLIPSIESDAST